ncbi:Six-hairpin glycosidase, partial [Linnemannia elongata AG-77]
LLDATLLFYEAQRSGHLPSDQRVKWRNDSALLDGKDAGIDLTGGYYDAGDYLKFIFPLTFTLTEICYGGIDFFEGYALAGKTHHLDQMVRWGTDWLIKAHPNNNTLYVQVGVSEVDNNYWGPDTGIPTPRPSFFVSNLKPGTDVMADAAAAFASCSVLYREKFKDLEYAGVLQGHAEALFSIAETALPQQTYQTVVPAANCCYASTGYLDELAWGAAWMYRVTRDPVYAAKASHYVSEYSKLEHGNVILPITWDDKTGLVYILMAGMTQGTAEGVQWQALAEKFGNFVIHAPKPCAFTSGGMYYCYGYSGDDTSNNRYNMNMTNALENETRGKIEAYRSFASRQVRYLLGDNPEKTPYVVGVHPNSPTNPHSSLASGGRSTDSIDTEPLKEAHILLGALVGGPDKNDRFQDLRSNWRQNEVALDYNAPFTSLMAYQVMTSHDPPPYATIAAG